MQADTFIQGMHGLGDNIYMRGYVRHFPGAYVSTPWPEIYADLDVKCVRPDSALRTQSKNIAASGYAWHGSPRYVKRCIQVRYRGPIMEAMSALFGVSPTFDLPRFASPVTSDRPIALIRPVTVRKEWLNPARNPKPEYVATAAKILRKRGFFVVSVADLQLGAEWAETPIPEADLYIHDGRLRVTELLGLFQAASVVVGGVGWIVPASVATGVPLYCVLGGNGGYNAPENLVSSAYVEAPQIGWAVPRKFCRCFDNRHDCEKDIDDFEAGFNQWLDTRATPERARLVA